MEIVPYYLTFLVDSQLFFQKNCYNFFIMYTHLAECFIVLVKNFLLCKKASENRKLFLNWATRIRTLK